MGLAGRGSNLSRSRNGTVTVTVPRCSRLSAAARSFQRVLSCPKWTKWTPGRSLSPPEVHAAKRKAARAEPVALRFETGKAKLAGHFPELEDRRL